jgi:hypothetical protein
VEFHANHQSYECFFAAGWGDQFMSIFPDQEMIVAINCGNFTSSGSISVFALVENYILPGLTE